MIDNYLKILGNKNSKHFLIPMVVEALDRLFVLAPESLAYFTEQDGEAAIEIWLDCENNFVRERVQLLNSRYCAVSLYDDPSDIFF